MHLTITIGQHQIQAVPRLHNRHTAAVSARVAPFVIVALILLLVGLAANRMGMALWYDEYRSLYNVGAGFMGPLSPGDILTRIAAENAWQAPTYYLILSAWGALTGWSEFTTRALSLFFGLLTVAMVYRFGRDAFSRRVGLLAAITLGMSGFFLHFLHEMRAYTLVALLAVVMMDAYWRLVYKGGGWRAALVFTLATAGLPYTHYFAVTAPITLALFHLLFVPKNRRWWRVPALMTLALVAFLPWLSVVLHAVSLAGADARQYQVLGPVGLARGLMMLFGNSSPALLLLFLGFGLVTRFRASRLLWFALLGGFVVIVALDQVVHILVEIKYAMVLIPLLALAAALGMDQLDRRGVSAWVLASLWAITGLISINNPFFEEQITPSVWRFPWQQAVAGIAPRAQDGDAALILLPDPSLLSKNYEPVMKYYFHDLRIRPTVVAPSPQTTDDRYFDLAVDGAKDAARLWVLYDKTRRPWRDGLLESKVLPDAGFTACGEVTAQAPVRLALFLHRPGDDDSLSPVARYSGLKVYDGGYPTTTDDDTLPVALGFASDIDSDVFSFGLHLVDQNGDLVAQKDEGLPTDDFACKTVDIDISAVPAGGYTLKLVVYNWQTGQRSLDVNGVDRPTLGTVTIAPRS